MYVLTIKGYKEEGRKIDVDDGVKRYEGDHGDVAHANDTLAIGHPHDTTALSLG